MKLFIHIGTEKTGTSSIQKYLYENRNTISQNGYHYLEAGIVGNNHLLLTLFCAPHSVKTSEIRRRLGLEDKQLLEKKLYQVKHDVLKEIKEVNSDNIIISSEHLSSRLDNINQLNKLKFLFDSAGVKEYKVILYLRRHDLLIPSYISTSLKVGNHQSFNVLNVNDSWLYYDTITSLWSKCFGIKSMSVTKYEPSQFTHNNIFTNFVTKIDSLDSSKLSFEKITVNKSLSGIKLAYLNLINKYRNRFSSKLTIDLVSKLNKIPDEYFSNRIFKIGSVNQKLLAEKYIHSNHKVANIFFGEDKLFDEEYSNFEFDKIPYITPDEVVLMNLYLNELSK